MRTMPSYLAGFGLLGTIFAAPLAGQERADTFQLEELVVTATRLPTPRAAAAAFVTVITGEELRALGIQYVVEALRRVTGAALVQTGAVGATTSLFLRGGESDYVQVLIDGVPANAPGGAFDFAHLTTDNIERIEVVRGPASVLYGSDAVTGVVQLFTRRGRGRPQGTLEVRRGLADRVGAGVDPRSAGTTSLAWRAELSGGAEHMGYSAALAHYANDGAYAFNNEYRNTTLSTRVHARPDERGGADLALRYVESEFHFPTDGSGQVVDRNQFQLQNALSLSLDAGRFLSDRLEARLLLAAREVEDSYDNQPDDAADARGSFHGTGDLARRSADARLNFHWTPGTVLTAGAELERQRGRSSSESRAPWGESSVSADIERLNRGFYAQLLSGWRGAFLNLGARLEANEVFGSLATYRAGAAFRRAGGTRLHAAAATGFKEPTFFESFGSGYGDRGNPGLRPERSRSWEVGVEQPLLRGRVSLAAVYFQQRFRDLIQYTFQPPRPDDPNYFNVASAAASGIELEAHVTGPHGFSGALGYAFLDTETQDPGFDTGSNAYYARGRRLLRRPAHTLTLGLGYHSPAHGRLNLTAQYVGDRDDLEFRPDFTVERVELPAYLRLDVAGDYRILRARGRAPELTATLQLENLLDESYQEARGFPARGRTLYLGARLGTTL
ncbi:MAG: TonB-dependent receptor [Gemmatimonadetes bacterium]|nr:TonB-dependent receptor [Gemmatimonadota bacterium]